MKQNTNICIKYKWDNLKIWVALVMKHLGFVWIGKQLILFYETDNRVTYCFLKDSRDQMKLLNQSIILKLMQFKHKIIYQNANQLCIFACNFWKHFSSRVGILKVINHSIHIFLFYAIWENLLQNKRFFKGWWHHVACFFLMNMLCDIMH